jgi:hypothetical protein
MPAGAQRVREEGAVKLKSLPRLHEELDLARVKLEQAEANFLRNAGWRYTCEKHSLWLWEREGVYVSKSTALEITERDIAPYEAEGED